MHLFGICMSSLEKRLFEFFLGLLEGFFFLLFFSLLLNCKNSLYILEINPLSYYI